jgi:hypothetical protein
LKHKIKKEKEGERDAYNLCHHRQLLPDIQEKERKACKLGSSSPITVMAVLLVHFRNVRIRMLTINSLLGSGTQAKRLLRLQKKTRRRMNVLIFSSKC